MGRFFKDIDWVTIFLLILISSFGLFTLVSLRSPLVYQQVLFVFLGILCLFMFSRIDGVVLIYGSPYFYILSLIAIGLTYFSADIRGASRWIDLGPIQIQPSELVKPFVLLFFSTMMVRFSPRKLRSFILHVIVFLIPFLLVFKQPDLGTAIVYASMWITMMVAGGIPFWFLGFFGVMGIIGIPFFWNLLQPFQRLRIMTFLNPLFDPKGAGYNAIQAMISVGSGQLFGKGLGKGTQSHLQFLPEYHTDFIFATIIEELGFVGGVVLFILYGIFLWRFLRPFLRKDRYHDIVFFYTFGFFGMTLVQIIVNTGMNMGIIPITGITLPFVSYGGSSFLSLCMSIGCLWSLRRATRLSII
ncbi:MAG: rod shape-determining protein RodA [Patescibacteria group bacterium]|nr:rod shape-determining protein RodA [Patescibacteria group bacterium]